MKSRYKSPRRETHVPSLVRMPPKRPSTHSSETCNTSVHSSLDVNHTTDVSTLTASVVLIRVLVY